MDRRTIQFFVVSLAIILASQALQGWLFPKPPKPVADQATTAADDTAKPAGERGDEPRSEIPDPAIAADDAAAAEPAAAAARVRRTLGSLDPSAARMLVTLTSRGAAVERIELADEKFHDQDDRSGYLGHLAVAPTEGGCRVGVVGAGLQPRPRSGRG